MNGQRAGARRLALMLAMIFVATPAAADDSQLWAGGSINVKLSDKWRFSEELTARFSNKRNGLYEIESNSLVGYIVGRGIMLWGGYTHDPQYAAGDFMIMEHRAREQVTVDNFATLGPGKLGGRVRMEQRWRDGISGTGWRVRPFIKYAVPFHKGGHSAFVLSIEPFVDLNDTAFQRTRGLDRTRTFVGISTPLASKLTLDAGYLNQHMFVRNGPDSDDHVASLALNLSL